MLNTDAWAYLKINHPLCAWATYRGTLVCPPSEPGAVSVWTASRIQSQDPRNINLELALEQYRQQYCPERISRLTGMFCFLDINSAELAALRWGGSFRLEYLAKLSLSEAGVRRDRLDSNWITNSASANNLDWIPNYWAGEEYPNQEPIWETLVDGRMIVLGTELRQRAYHRIKAEHPNSLMFLEIARQAAWVGSDLGNIFGFLQENANEIVLEYCMDMRDAHSPEFLQKLSQLREEGHPINYQDMKPHIDKDSFGNVPDLSRYRFRCPKEDFTSLWTPNSL